MIKVFIVEDEVIVREGLRDNIPWEKHGCTCVGDASDGEMALPQIRRLQPDVLITDIKMPFMDGLELSRLVRKELPNIKIIIISGYDDFEYARTAISIGVEQYLLKPITKAVLLKVMEDVSAKLKEEQTQQSNYLLSQKEAQEYELFARKRFFERLLDGKLSVTEIYDEAEKLKIDLTAPRYNILLLAFQSDLLGTPGGAQREDQVTQAQEALTRFFLMCPDLTFFRWSPTSYALLVRGTPEQVEENTNFCVENIRRHCQGITGGADWYVAVATPVDRLSQLPNCFREASRMLSYRHMNADQHILTPQTVRRSGTGRRIENVDLDKVAGSAIQNFLKTGTQSEVDDFLREYLDSFGVGAIESVMYSQYTILSICLNTFSVLASLGYEKSDLGQLQEALPPIERIQGRSMVEPYIRTVLSRAIDLRDQASQRRYRGVLKQALDYIDQHFTEESLSLNQVAQAANVGASYFSALFSQEMGQTFVGYLTQKRMERAKELLRQTDRRSSDIAAAVGYKDPHYFSYLFKKTQGCTPRDYRSGKEGKG